MNLWKRLRHRPDRESAAHRYVTQRLAAAGADTAEIDLDLTGASWEFFLQDVVKRSRTLAYNQRRHRFHLQGDATRRVRRHGQSTSDLIEDFLSEAGLDGDAAVPAQRGAP